jgi:diaminopimelate decarboxylase
MLNKKINKLIENRPTPFYYYDLDILRSTLDLITEESKKYNFKIHYAIKANPNPRLLEIIASYGLGADCVSWNEAERALESGFKASDIVFAGVGKSDREIVSAINADIACFNCESLQEIEVIDQLSGKTGKVSRIALRINPLIDAHTHKYITTGVEDSKFGINTWELEDLLEKLTSLKNIKLIGIHFHIGSQITKMSVFKLLCNKLNELQDFFASCKINLEMINVGGGLGIDYENPEKTPDFKSYFSLFKESVELRKGQRLHFEPGRSVIGQCGSLISRVLYIKKGGKTHFAIIDAGMTDLIRPALYQAYHKIENLTSEGPLLTYDVAGPICESSDTFGKSVKLPETSRGDIIAIRSAGAYGEAMASRYNLRDLPPSVFSDEV